MSRRWGEQGRARLTPLLRIYYFTAGPDEVRAWTIRKGTKAPQAAGVIHTDFEKKFVCGEIIQYDDLVELGSETACKANGKSKCWRARLTDRWADTAPPSDAKRKRL